MTSKELDELVQHAEQMRREADEQGLHGVGAELHGALEHLKMAAAMAFRFERRREQAAR